MPLPKLSEKGSERVFEGGFGRYEDAEMGPKEPSRRSVELRHGCSQGFSDSFSRHWCENSLSGGSIFMASGWPGKGHGSLG
jgi:hypothetical protein